MDAPDHTCKAREKEAVLKQALENETAQRLAAGAFRPGDLISLSGRVFRVQRATPKKLILKLVTRRTGQP